jgi:predicted helicase
MTLHQYIETINQRFRQGNATEHTYRGDLQHLLESLVVDIRATNEPKRQSCGAPDYILTRGEIPVGFIEAKDIGEKDLGGKKKTGNQEQFNRYKAALPNLIITDYIDFHFYKEGVLSTKISIGKIENGAIIPIEENYIQFTQLFNNFCETISQSIKSPTRLAEMMAGKARLMADIIENALNEDDSNDEVSNLKRQMLTFKKMLIHDLNNKSYSDLYSQTIVYGLFAARYHDPSIPTFSREEALTLIPRSNPFLGQFFLGLTGNQLDSRLVWIVDELVNVFLASDVASIMKNFGKSTKQEDPVVHFYETFLGAYNPELKKARGVWYTPQPVVNFIVRAVDDLLKTEFDITEGLADTRKKKIKVNFQGNQIERDVHRVQILDPATGTGTFLAETIRHIHKKYEGIQGIWSKYVEDDLIPRINGFELLVASYAMAHLKLDMLLTETGYIPTREQRLRIFLTNSLEEPTPDSGVLWGNFLADEADQANEVKRDTPIMCIIGNPPYSGVSSNKGEWIQNLIEDYKYIDGVHFNERKHWLNDDYVKFLRYGQYYIEKNEQGILAFITPHGFLDNITFRGMRWNLLKTFDKIYTINLHGNSKKKETAPDGSADINVFDIQQGVSINIFVKTSKKKKGDLGKVFHFDLFGKREFKYDFLTENSLNSLSFQELSPNKPNLFFVPKNDVGIEEYEYGFKVDELFTKNNVGFISANDLSNISFNKLEANQKIEDILNMDEKSWRLKYKRKEDSESWKYLWAKADALKNKDKELNSVSYRPFDNRYTLYTGKSGGMYARPSNEIMQLFINRENLGLSICKQFKTGNKYHHAFITNKITDSTYVSNRTSENTSIFPLYIYPDTNEQHTTNEKTAKIPNLKIEIIKQIAANLNLSFTKEKEASSDTFAPIDILDYIYAILHSPTYREKYKEFLKIDFPRVPYPNDKDTFWKLVKLGGEMRQLHLLETAEVENPIAKYPHSGTNIVDKIKYQDGSVYINETQCFEGVSEVVWNFYIGGYQPAQKWLKDRKGRVLQIDDIRHYIKIIFALNKTDFLMKMIERVNI